MPLRAILTILFGVLVGAFFVGGGVYAALYGNQEDAISRFCRGIHINTPLAALLGAALGGSIAWLMVRVEDQDIADAAQVSRAMNLEFVAKVPRERLAPFQLLFHDTWSAHAHNLMIGKVGDCNLLVVDSWNDPGVGALPLPETNLIIYNDNSLQTTFDLSPSHDTALVGLFVDPFSLVLNYLAKIIAFLLSFKGSREPVERRFLRNYELEIFGSAAGSDMIHRVLGEKGIAFFAKNAGYWVRSGEGYLILTKHECKAKDRAKMVEEALIIRSFLQEAATIHRGISVAR